MQISTLHCDSCRHRILHRSDHRRAARRIRHYTNPGQVLRKHYRNQARIVHTKYTATILPSTYGNQGQSHSDRYYTIGSWNTRYATRTSNDFVFYARAASCGKGSTKRKKKKSQDQAQASLPCRRSIHRPRCTDLEHPAWTYSSSSCSRARNSNVRSIESRT